MNVYFDTEFTGLHKNTTLISIGLEDQNSKKLYAEFTDYDESQIDEWLQVNVIDRLILQDIDHNKEVGREYWWGGFDDKGNIIEDNSPVVIFDSIHEIRFKGSKEAFKVFLETWLQARGSEEDKIEVWSDCLHYDWVLFLDIFGTAFDIPEYVYYIPFDICTSFKERGIDPDISRESFAGTDPKLVKKHHAGWDATIIRLCHEKLIQLDKEKTSETIYQVTTTTEDNFLLSKEDPENDDSYKCVASNVEDNNVYMTEKRECIIRFGPTYVYGTANKNVFHYINESYIIVDNDGDKSLYIKK